MSENVAVESVGLVDEVMAGEQQAVAARRVAELLSAEVIDSLVADATESGVGVEGASGLLNQLTKAVQVQCRDDPQHRQDGRASG